MSAKHTDGAIRYDYEPGYCGELIARDGTTVAAFVDEPSEANARRLVACWNACDGLPTESLEKLGTLDRANVEMNVFRAHLLAQRDALLAELHRMENHPASRIDELPEMARAAIARVKGGTT